MAEDVIRALGLLCLGSRLKRLGERFQAETDAFLATAGLGVTTSHYPYLAALDRQGPLSLGDLAISVGVSQPGVTRTVNHLITQGLLRADPAPDDQRRKILSLTEVGEQVITLSKQGLWPAIEQAVRSVCYDLDGPLLDQLSALEKALDSRPFSQRCQSFQPPDSPLLDPIAHETHDP